MRDGLRMVREGRVGMGYWSLSRDLSFLLGVGFVVTGCGGGFDLERESDTGSSSLYYSDRITNDTTPTFVVRGEGGKEIEVLEGGKVLIQGTLGKESGEARVTVTLVNTDPADGVVDKTGQDHTLEARYKGGGLIGSLTIRLDLVKPEKPTLRFFEGAARVKEMSDAADGRDIRVTYEVGNVESGSTVRLYDSTGKVMGELREGGGGTERLTAKVKSTTSVTAKVFDKAGNESAVSGALSISGTTASEALGFRDEERVDWEYEGGGVWRGSLGDGFDADLRVRKEGEAWRMWTSLEEEGRLILREVGGGGVVEVVGDDVSLRVEDGEWLMGYEGGEVEYIVGVGSVWMEGIG
jgi:hypothetical protein